MAEETTSSNRKRNVLVTAAAVILAALVLLGGGTYAYLTGSSDPKENLFATNSNSVELAETTGEGYDIVPGTSQDKDPTVTATYTLDSYVFVEVTDTTYGLVDYEIADGWEELVSARTTSGDTTTYVYYRLLEGSGTDTFEVLKDSTVYYSADITNEDMEKAAGGVSLTFQAYIIQSELLGSAPATAGVAWSIASNTDPSSGQFVSSSGYVINKTTGALYETPEAAILGLEEGETMALLANATVSTGIGANDEVPEEYAIDLNGYTLTLEASMQLSAVDVVRVTQADLDAGLYSGYPVGYVIRSTPVATDLTIENGTIEVASSSGYIRTEAGTDLTLSDVTFTNTSGSTTAQKAIQYYIADASATNAMTVVGCTFDNTTVSVTGSSGNAYELSALFDGCEFAATLGNGGACVSFNHYIYGDIAFEDCSFDVTANGSSAPSGIEIQATPSNIGNNTFDLTLDGVTFKGTSFTSPYWPYTVCTPVLVSMRNTSVVNVADNKESAYSYTLDGNPVEYDGTAIETAGTAIAVLEALESGEPVVLTGAVSVSASELNNALNTAGSASQEIYLEGNTLTVSGGTDVVVPANASLTISGGTIAEATSVSGTSAFLSVSAGASLTLDGVTVNSDASVVFPDGDASEVNILNSTITTTGVYGVGTNASTNHTVAINIENSTIKATDAADSDQCAVMMNVSGTLNISDSTITGGRQGVVVRGGTASISASTITSTCGYSNTAQYYSATWGGGNEVPMAALVVGNNHGNSYQYGTTVTLSGVTLTVGDQTNTVPMIYAAQYPASGSSGLSTVLTGANSTDTIITAVGNGGTLTVDNVSVSDGYGTCMTVGELS